MSAALDTERSDIAVASHASTSVSTTTDIPARDEVVNITFTFDQQSERWTASSDNPAIEIPFNQLAQITWNLVVPSGIDPDTLFFNTPAILFPQLQVPAPMVFIADPSSNSKQRVALWANVESNRTGTYHYTINVSIAGQTVTHDPTVENDPPTGP